MTTGKKLGLWLGVAAVAAGVAYFVLKPGAGGSKPEVRYDTAKVDRGNIVAKVTATGTLSSLVTVQVGSQVSGRLQQIFVDFNSQVKKGQVIAKIDPQLFQAALAQARANALAAHANETKAKVQAAEAERQYSRSKSLAEQKLIAQADLDTAQSNRDAALAQVDAAKASVAQAEAALEQAKVNLEYTTIVSPINGVVISRSVDVGQTVAASLQAPTLFVIAEDLRKMQVDTSVAEADIGKLQPGMRATFLVDAYPGERFEGTVRQIRNAAQTVQNVVTYDAVIDVENPDLKLRPGMTANVNFVYARVDDALRVPNAALRFKPSAELRKASGGPGEGGKRGGGAQAATGSAQAQGGARTSSTARGGARGPGGGGGEGDVPNRRTLWVLRDGKPEPAPVRTGVTDGSFTEVLDGKLAEGDAVILSGGGDAPSGPRPPGGMRMF